MILTYLGIDLGAHTGYGILDHNGGYAESGVWDLSARRGDGDGAQPAALAAHLCALYTALTHEIEPSKVLVSYELPPTGAHKGGAAARAYGRYQGVLVATLEKLGHSLYKAITPAEAKAAATGKGNAGKGAMIATANERWGIEVADDNEADALWMAEAGRLWLAVP